MSQRRPIEFWRDIRALVEKGLSLKKASQQFKVSFSHLRERAVAEGWKLCRRGRPRTLDYVNEERRAEMVREEREHEVLQAELRHEAEVLVIDVKKAELLAQKVLAQHSTEMKVRLSELVVQTAEELRSQEMRPKDRALALASLKSVGNQLYGWDREPDIQRMKRAATSCYEADIPEDFPPTGAVNLALINTTPEQLAAMAKAKGVFATECNGQGAGPSALTPEQPPAATHGPPFPKKEALHLPIEQPIQPRRDTDLQQAEKANRVTLPVPKPLKTR
jgi:hypothetical protein